jgi:2-polyprenyl-3-methyl-5-hydroxy-6-metoxy-1,4-benzoquinol methylase
MQKNNYNYELDLNNKNSLSVIVSKIRAGSTVLEFGPANGRMTRYLKEVLCCKIYGVEIDAEAAQESSVFTEKMVVDDIENLSWLSKYGNLRFDVIVFADVLEHLHDPLSVLSHAATLLQEEGDMYVSLPNITHNAIIMELFKEAFHYRNAGLLDSTHIRFFSKKSFSDLIEKSPLQIIFEDTVSISPEWTELGHHYEDFPCSIADFLEHRKYGEAYQFVYGLKKKGEYADLPTHDMSARKFDRYAQLFVDSGKGYGEQVETIILETQNGEVSLEFDISRYDSILGLRFDPFNRCAAIRIDECVLILANGESIPLTHGVSNARLSDEGVDYFATYDPIYHLNIEESEIFDSGIVRIKMHCTEYDFVSVVEKIIDLQSRYMASQNDIIASQNDHIHACEAIINRSWNVRASRGLSRLRSFFRRDHR